MPSTDHDHSRTTASVRVTANGLVITGIAFPRQLLAFVDSVLRGIGQVMLQDNRFTGLLFLIGIFWNSALFGCGVLLGTAASTATAMLLGIDRAKVRAGLYGLTARWLPLRCFIFFRRMRWRGPMSCSRRHAQRSPWQP